jgi:[ribosomal protein S5]-alanine N-acetyltransferase
MLFTQPPVLRHNNAIIRSMRDTDLPHWLAALRSPAVFEHTSWNLPADDADALARLAVYVWNEAQFTSSSLLRFVIADRETDRFLGTAGFHTVQPDHRSAELAYDLCPEAWGRGLASAAARSLTDWAHTHVGLVRVQATVMDSNARSLQVLARCGFEREGLLRSYRQARGVARDFWMHSHLVTPTSVG